MRKYKLVTKKGEGTFSEVLKAQNIKDGKYRAIKCMKNHFESVDQVNNLREIQALRRLSPHPNIITLEEVLYDQPTGRLALVFELMDANLYELIRGRKTFLNAKLVKSYMFQLMNSLDHMHKKGIFHRDIKPENILIERTGKRLKLADFGSCRGINSKQPFTEYISTRWYRAPECLLTDGYYGPEMDVWGAGCVLFEIVSLYPLFPGADELDQINRVHKILGSPSPEMLVKFQSIGGGGSNNRNVNFNFPSRRGTGIAPLIPQASSECKDVLIKALAYDASRRITARAFTVHPYFAEMRREGDTEPTVSYETKQSEVKRKLAPLSLPKMKKYADTSSDHDSFSVTTTIKKAAREALEASTDNSTSIKRLKSNNNHNDSNSTLPPINHQGSLSLRHNNSLKRLLPKLDGDTEKKTRRKIIAQAQSKNNNNNNGNRKKKTKYANVASSGYGAASKPRKPVVRGPPKLKKIHR